MPYKNQTQTTPVYKLPKGAVDTMKGTIQDIKSFYNTYPHKIKASNIFPEMANGSSTGFFTIIIFYDKQGE